MKKVGFIIFLLVFIVANTAFAQNGLNNKRINLIAQSVVQILALDANGRPFASGSGTIVDKTGLIYTNLHVVMDADDYAIYMISDMNEAPTHQYYASVVGVSPYIDFAELQIDRDKFGRSIDKASLDLPYIASATTQIDHGEHIYIFGYPGIGEGYLVLTQGTITTVENGSVGSDRMPVWYQTDAEISPGNSGGLVVNENGEFVGIPTSVQSETNTGGRLGGILPFTAIQATLDASDGLVSLDQLAPPAPVLTGGVSIDCGSNGQFDNGVEVTVILMRAGFSYTATAIGINGFDPVLAVYDPSTKRGVCTDNSPEASYYTVSLPSTGDVPPSNLTAQIQFSQNTGQNMANQSIVVGGANNMAGEFVLILEGMAVTAADGPGDPFSVQITPGMVGSGVPLTVYQLATVRGLDTFVYSAYFDNDKWNLYTNSDGDYILYCDNAGTSSCWGAGSSASLAGSAFAQKGQKLYSASSTDALIHVPLDGFADSDLSNLSMSFLMSSSGNTSGNYTTIIHAGTQ